MITAVVKVFFLTFSTLDIFWAICSLQWWHSFWRRANTLAAILGFKSRGRLGTDKSATKGVGMRLKEKAGG